MILIECEDLTRPYLGLRATQVLKYSVKKDQESQVGPGIHQIKDHRRSDTGGDCAEVRQTIKLILAFYILICYFSLWRINTSLIVNEARNYDGRK